MPNPIELPELNQRILSHAGGIKPEPILSAFRAYNDDPRQPWSPTNPTGKLNNTIGIFAAAKGVHASRVVARTHVDVVTQLDGGDISHGTDHGYKQSEGNQAYLRAKLIRLLGAARFNSLLNRPDETMPATVARMQTMGGIEGLSISSAFFERVFRGEELEFAGDDSWTNYALIFGYDEGRVKQLPWRQETPERTLDHDANLAVLKRLKRMHPAGIQMGPRNPDGLYRTPEQLQEWMEAVKGVRAPILDLAYPNLGNGMSEDLLLLHQMIDQGYPCILVASDGKITNFNDERPASIYTFHFPPDVTKAIQQIFNTIMRQRHTHSSATFIRAMERVYRSDDLFAELMRESDENRATFNANRALYMDFFEEAGLPVSSWLVDRRGMYFTLSPDGFSDDQIQYQRDAGLFSLPDARMGNGYTPEIARPRIERIVGITADSIKRHPSASLRIEKGV